MRMRAHDVGEAKEMQASLFEREVQRGRRFGQKQCDSVEDEVRCR